MQNEDISSQNLYVRTPLIHSTAFKKPFDVYLKLENTQPSGSFKTRGISYHCQRLVRNGCRHLVSSSGGNAGLAVAYSGWKLGIKTTVFVPKSTPEKVVERLREKNANVFMKGSVWDEANEHAMDFVKKNKSDEAALVHPFDHEDIWQGHSSIVSELTDDMNQVKPSLIVLSVGGGGLLCGILQGLWKVGWGDIPVIACETYGADCLFQAVKADRLVTLDDITSIAKCLGALTASKNAFEWTKKHQIMVERVTDKDACTSCERFADDHKMIVEPACGAALAVVYGDVIEKLQSAGTLKTNISSVVVIVCGGHAVDLQDFIKWKKQFDEN